MIENKVSVISKFKEKLVGIQTVPSEKKSKYPTVVLTHGFGVEKHEGGMFDQLAEKLADVGILSYRFDFSGRGESEGNYSKSSLSKMKSELSTILGFVQSQPCVDKHRIGILGQSFGTPTTVTLAPKVKAIVLMGSTSHPKEILIKLFGNGYNPDGISVRTKSNGQITHMGPQFWKDFDNHKLLESIKKIHCPILFIHGEQDDKVPISEMEAYYQNANPPKEKIIIKGADHGLRPHRDEMYEIVSDWFKKQL
ncbi:alpha/beta hydrolase [Candidatus Woesearchaeota archaeon]|nr:alpha/beta hydrolase [Candidatus Woesearchaeota archaeon]